MVPHAHGGGDGKREASRTRRERVLSLALGLAASAMAVQAAVPVPQCLYYGQARNAYGWPYGPNAGAVVILMVNGNECGRATVGRDIAPGVNFVIPVPMDDGTGAYYSPSAARQGDRLGAAIKIGAVIKPVVVTPVPPVPAPGSAVYLKVAAGTDRDGDGLPDEWEQYLVDYDRSDRYTNIVDILPGDDFDGDGASNLHEFLSGTYPEYEDDAFIMENLEPTPEGRLRFRFLSVPGMAYGVQTAPSMNGPWTECPYAFSATETLVTGYFVGAGGYMTLYIAPQGQTAVYRLVIR